MDEPKFQPRQRVRSLQFPPLTGRVVSWTAYHTGSIIYKVRFDEPVALGIHRIEHCEYTEGQLESYTAENEYASRNTTSSCRGERQNHQAK
jgi:hypothetical protein